MINLKQHAIELCNSILKPHRSHWQFEENCVDLKETMVKLSALGRYGDIKTVMTEFDGLSQNHSMPPERAAFLLSVMPASVDTALFFLPEHSPEVASVLVKNLIQHESFSGEETKFSYLVQQLFEQGYGEQGCDLLDAYLRAHEEDHVKATDDIFEILDYAIDIGYPEILAWARVNESLITASYLRCSNSKICMSVGVELYELGLESLGTEIIKEMFAPSDFDLCKREELIGLKPSISRITPRSQSAYITYMLTKDGIGPEWLDISLNISQFKHDPDGNLTAYRNKINKAGLVVQRTAMNTLCAAIMRNAQTPQDLDIITPQMNAVGCEYRSPVMVLALTHVLPGIMTSAKADTTWILNIDKMLNKNALVNYGSHLSDIGLKINQSIPDIKLKDIVSHIDALERLADKNLIGSVIDTRWPNMDEKFKGELRDAVPKSIALCSKCLKGHVIELELGL